MICAHLLRHRDTVVAIMDEVGVAHLVDFDRRQTGKPGDTNLEICPARGSAVLKGQEIAGEVFVAAHTAHNGAERNVAQFAFAYGRPGVEHAAHVFVGEQFGVASCEASAQLFQVRAQAGAAELLKCIVKAAAYGFDFRHRWVPGGERDFLDG